MSDWKPISYPSMSPYLITRDGEALIKFLTTAFDAKLLRRFNHEDGTLMHAEVKIDDSVVMVGGGVEHPGTSAHIHLYVQDVGAVFARALEAGAIVVQEPVRKRADDDLRGGVQDPSGTTWWIARQ